MHHHGPVPTACGVARSLGISYRTLVRRSAAAGLPAPVLFISWSRILMAAHIARTEWRTAGCLARCIGFASARSFRDVLRRHTGLSIVDLREPCTFARLCRTFIDAHLSATDGIDGEVTTPLPSAEALSRKATAAEHSAHNPSRPAALV
jgi:AraC-like DNA-binding protein